MEGINGEYRQANEVILGIMAHENPQTEECEFPENLGEETQGKCSCRLEMKHLKKGWEAIACFLVRK